MFTIVIQCFCSILIWYTLIQNPSLLYVYKKKYILNNLRYQISNNLILSIKLKQLEPLSDSKIWVTFKQIFVQFCLVIEIKGICFLMISASGSHNFVIV